MSKKKRRKIAKNANFDKLGAPKVRQCCKTCRFFDIAFIEDEEDRSSWCTRFPPVYVGPPENAMGADEFPSEFRYWEQPMVGIGQWCGEWRPRK